MSAGMQLALPPAPPYRARVETHGYMGKLLELAELRDCVGQAVTMLRAANIQFDAVAFRGISGAILGPQIALALGKSMILVRKPNDGSHAQQQFSYFGGVADRILTPLVEGDINARTYIIVDDFQSSGVTAKAIRKEIAKVIPSARCLGVCEVTRLYPGNDVLTPIKYDNENPL